MLSLFDKELKPNDKKLPFKFSLSKLKFNFGSAGLVKFTSLEEATKVALRFHDIEFVVKFKELYTLRYIKYHILYLTNY